MTELSAVEQAWELRRRISEALAAMDRFNTEELDEPEVIMRQDAIVGMLLMASNDVRRMIELWERD